MDYYNVDKVKEEMKIKRGIQAICYVSEAALAVATGVFEWTIPAASLFGIPMKLVRDSYDKDTLEEDYVNAVDNALASTKLTFRNSHSKLQIIEELSACVGTLDECLADAINKTEAYQLTYSTEKDARDIIAEFETHFRKEIAEHQILSNFYVLRTSNTTLDILKKAKITIDSDSTKIESIYKSIDSVGRDTSMIITYYRKLADIIVSSTIVFFFFIIASTLMNFRYGFATITYTFAAIMLSEFLIRNLPIRGEGRAKQLKLAIVQVVVVITFVLMFVGRTLSIDDTEILLVASSIMSGEVLKFFLMSWR